MAHGLSMTSRDPERSNSWPQFAYRAQCLENYLSQRLQIWYAALYQKCRAGAEIIFPKGRLGHVTPTIFGSTVGYPSDSLASCFNIGVDMCCLVCLQSNVFSHFYGVVNS